MSVALANLSGRSVVVRGERAADVERASAGRFGADPMAALATWDVRRDAR